MHRSDWILFSSHARTTGYKELAFDNHLPLESNFGPSQKWTVMGKIVRYIQIRVNVKGVNADGHVLTEKTVKNAKTGLFDCGASTDSPVHFG